MIRVSATVDANGFLRKLEATGHAGWSVGSGDPVCAAVSILLRTCGRLAESWTGLETDSRGLAPGDFFLSVDAGDDGAAHRWQGVGAMVLKGLSDLSRDYPENVEFELTVSGMEVNHGS